MCAGGECGVVWRWGMMHGGCTLDGALGSDARHNCSTVTCTASLNFGRTCSVGRRASGGSRRHERLGIHFARAPRPAPLAVPASGSRTESDQVRERYPLCTFLQTRRAR